MSLNLEPNRSAPTSFYGVKSWSCYGDNIYEYQRSDIG